MGTMTPQRLDFGTLKATIHRKLIQTLNLDRLTTMDRESVRREVGQIIESLVVAESTPMTFAERERLAQEVLDEVFGLGPLEPLLKDPTVSDILVNTYKSVYVERNGFLEHTPIQFRDDTHLMSIIDRIVSAVGRRVDESSPDGGRAPAGWLARERHYSSARRGRAVHFHSPIWARSADRRRPDPQQQHHAADCGDVARLRESAAKYAGLRRHRLRQDHAAQCSFVVHLQPRTHRYRGRRGGIAASPGTRGPSGNAAAQYRRQGAVRQRQLVINCLRMRPTASSLARSAAKKRWTCCRP